VEANRRALAEGGGVGDVVVADEDDEARVVELISGTNSIVEKSVSSWCWRWFVDPFMP
jgi:hypothetical protein